MDQEVAKTLAELELKLRSLERELTALGRHGEEPAAGTPRPGPAPVPPPQPQAPQPPPGRLVDEAIEQPERRYSMESQETAFGEIPATKDEREAIDLSELVMFKEKMQHTLQGLIDEYSRLLSLRPRR